MSNDRNEAMRLAEYARGDEYQRATEAAIDLINELDERIAEMESRVHTCGPTCSKAGCINRRVTAERDQLLAEVERLRADAERLDWLEKCTATQLPKDSEAMRRRLWHRPAGAGNIRAAIDHARTTHKDEG